MLATEVLAFSMAFPADYFSSAHNCHIWHCYQSHSIDHTNHRINHYYFNDHHNYNHFDFYNNYCYDIFNHPNHFKNRHNLYNLNHDNHDDTIEEE